MDVNKRKALRVGWSEQKTHRHSTNPFLANWEPETVVRQKKIDLSQRPAFYADTNEPLAGKILVDYERDGRRFIRIFHEWLPELGYLSATARRVLDFVCYAALPNNSIVHVPLERALEFMRNTQPKSFYDGVMELVQFEYLAKTERREYYFLNPQKIFNGTGRNIKSTFTKPKKP